MAKRTDLAKKDNPKLEIPFALQHFGGLPDEAIVRDKVVAGLFGCSVPTVWRMAKDGRIPKPIRPSLRITGWQVGGLRKVLASA